MYFVLFRVDSSGRYIRIILSVLLPVKQLWLASWWANVDKKALHLSRRTAFIKNCQSYGSLHNWVRSVIHLKQVNNNAYCLLYLRWIKSLLKPKYTSYGPLGLKDAYTLYHCSMVAFKFRHKHAVRGFFFLFFSSCTTADGKLSISISIRFRLTISLRINLHLCFPPLSPPYSDPKPHPLAKKNMG